MCKLVLLSLFCLNFIYTNVWAYKCATPTKTTISGTLAPTTEVCSGDLIFEDTFKHFNLKTWQHEITLSGGGNWEFQYYSNNRSNSFVKKNRLHIKPTYLSDDFGEDFLYSGTLDVNGGGPADQCTNPSFYGCSRTGSATNVINPIKSARIRTINSFSFKYGTVMVKAKMPAGDWLWPAVWLLPTDQAYGKWPSSGEIDLLESRGNKKFTNAKGINIGTQQASSTLHWGPFYQENQWARTHWEKNNATGFDTAFHVYKVVWSPKGFEFYIDEELIGQVNPPDGGFWELAGFQNDQIDNPWKYGTKMAPFDQEFHLIINLAVGGITFFPDDGVNEGGKPWKNDSPTSSTDFWQAKSQWEPTWNFDTDDSHLVIDYVRVYAL